VTVNPGDTFVFDPSGGTNRHLWVVLAVYEPDHDFLLWAALVSITTMTARADESCVLGPDDEDRHPFVHHPSYAFYARVVEVEVDRLEEIGDPHVPAAPELLSRLRKGLHKSPFTRRGFKNKVPVG